MDALTLLQKIRKVEIKAKGLSEQLFSGQTHTAFIGRGMTFHEVREYAPGDDVRHIDWNVAARMGSPFVKLYQEEREQTIMLIVDGSKSTVFGTQGALKKDFITELAATLAYAAVRNQDNVGLILFSDKVEAYFPPRKGMAQVLRIIRCLLVHKSTSSGTNMGVAFETLYRRLSRKSLCFLISDFYVEIPQKELAVVCRRHNCMAIRVKDASEEVLPMLGMIPTLNPENGTFQWLDTSSEKVSTVFAEQMTLRAKKWDTALRKVGAKVITLNSAQAYLPALKSFLEKG